MSDIFKEVEEDVRRERYAKLWQAYGRYFVAVAVAIVVATASGVWWRDFSRSQREADSTAFSAALNLSRGGASEQAATAFAGLADSAGAGYAVLARLEQASAQARAGDREGAIALYDRVAADTGVDARLRGLARLLAAQHLVDSGDRDELITRLEPLMDAESPWRFSARELRALLDLRTGSTEEARRGYEGLVDDPEAPPGIRARAAELLAALRAAE